jgi:hypothetical protein
MLTVEEMKISKGIHDQYANIGMIAILQNTDNNVEFDFFFFLSKTLQLS